MRNVKIGQLLDLKAGPADGLGEGQFTGYASVFGNVDSYGDVVLKGAFADSIKSWSDSGRIMPCLYGHNMTDPFYNIGSVTDAVEDDRGLKVTVQLDMDNHLAVQTYRLLKGRRLSQMSFAYDVVEANNATRDGVKVTELIRLDLHEVSVVPIGANRETDITDVKSGKAPEAKAGRVLSQKNIDILREAGDTMAVAVGLIKSLLEAADGDEKSDVGQASVTGPDKTEEHPSVGVKADDPSQGTSAMDQASAALLLASLKAGEGGSK